MKATADYQTPDRMSAKLAAIPLPELRGKAVLDVGCDERFWCDLALERGAKKVIGIDRGRRGHEGQWINQADYTMDLGKQWHELGKFDVIFCFSLYHHIYESAGGEHQPIWYWFWRQLAESGVLLWENPVDTSDAVVGMNVKKEYHANYYEDAILAAAHRYFRIEYIGPALHESTRKVYRFTRKERQPDSYGVVAKHGAGGATRAFLYSDNRRIREIQHRFGIEPIPGSLNLNSDPAFDLNYGYYRTKILDVVDRSKGLDSEWASRWLRLYPCRIAEQRAWAFRFEGEKYSKHFVELISDIRLRDYVPDQTEIVLWRD